MLDQAAAVEASADVHVRGRASNRTAAFVDGLSGIDAATHPAATRVGREFFTLPLAEIFEAGLDLILAGLRSKREG